MGRGLIATFIKSILSRPPKTPVSFKSRDVDRDYRAARKQLIRANMNTKIGTAREKDKGLLWFFTRKNP